MDVQRCATATEFLAATAGYRGAEPVRTNVLGTVATGVASGARSYDECFWWVASDDDEVVGAALRTVPFGLHLGPMTPGCAAAIGTQVARADPSCPWVTGPVAAACEIASVLCGPDSPGGPPTPSQRQLLQTIESLEAPEVHGELRRATLEDATLVDDWLRAFAHELGEVTWPNQVDQAESIESGRIFLWVCDGEVVSLAGHSFTINVPGGSIARVGPVYTPPAQRGLGYASAVTAGVVDLLMRQGSTVMLFSDADNPTSNSVYRRLGFRVVDEVVRIRLDARA